MGGRDGVTLGQWITLPGGMEALYWSSVDTTARLRSADIYGLLLGTAMHFLAAHLKTTWHAYARALAVLAGFLQLAQVGVKQAKPPVAAHALLAPAR